MSEHTPQRFSFSRRTNKSGPKSKDRNYHIRLAPKGEAKPDVKYNYRIYKQKTNEPFDPEKAEQIYHMWGDPADEIGLICDCPSSMYHQFKDGDRTCKHVPWVTEVIENLEAGNPTEHAYYSTEAERVLFEETTTNADGTDQNN